MVVSNDIQAFVLQGDGKVHDLSPSEAVAMIRADRQFVWIHVTANENEAATKFLHDELKFHALAVEDALSPNERPALQEFDDSIFLVATAVVPENSHERYIEIGFFLQKHSLVTVSREPCPMVDYWIQRWRRNPLEVGHNPAFLLHSLLDSIIDSYFPVVDGLEDAVEDLGDQIFQGDRSQVHILVKLKKRLLEVRRRTAPMRDVLNSLLRRDLTLIPADAKLYFQDVYDHTLRVTEMVELNRDTLASILDVHLSVVSNNLNDIMRKMTIIATILMSAALIAGIFGMNFEQTWPSFKWGGGYGFSLILMIVTSLGELAIFKKLGWF